MPQETPQREVKCNCFPDLVHVPNEGEFFVRNGKVLKVMESEMTDNGGDPDCDAWTVYTVAEDEDEDA